MRKVVLKSRGRKIDVSPGNKGNDHVTENAGKVPETAGNVLTETIPLLPDFHPGFLNYSGLLPALMTYFNYFEKENNIHINFRHSGVEYYPHWQINTAAYGIIKGALDVISRHFGVKQVDITIWHSESVLNIEIWQNGNGLVTPDLEPEEIVDLTVIRRRTESLGGTVKIEASAEKWAMLARLPVPVATKEHC